MSAPNVNALTTITSKVTQAALTTSTTDLVSNASGSGQAMRIASLYIANIHATSSGYVTVVLNKGGTACTLLNGAEVPVNCTLVVIDRESPLNLEENDKLQASCPTGSGYLNAIVSHEVLS